MLSALEFAPVAVFGLAYYLHGIYVATAALMVAMLVLLVIDFARLKHIPTMHAVSAVLVFVFGAATLILHDQRFIQWKPTVLFWLISLGFLGSFWIGRRTLAEHFLGKALGEMLSGGQQIEPRQWRMLNAQCVIFYALLGALNLVVAFNLSERAWVNFKLFGLTGATALFMMGQVLWVTRPRGTGGVRVNAADRVERIRQVLTARLAPVELTVRDDSAAHAGHAGAREGGHFSVSVVSELFAGRTRMQRHQLVYAAVADLMRTDIHALSIQARTPQES